MKKIYIFVLLLHIISNQIQAQADISMSTSWYNRSSYNPASIAKLDYLYFFTNARQQWNGITDAPKTLNLQISGFNYDLSSALGLSIISDQIGFVKSFNPMLSYAYRINNNEKWSLSFGISAGIFSNHLNSNHFDPEVPFDPSLMLDFEKTLTPDANIGVEFQSNYLILGLSTTHIFSKTNNLNVYLNSNHRYAYFVFKNTDSELYNFYAGIQVANRSNFTYLELNTSIRFKNPTGLQTGSKELFELGFTYRTSKQMTALFGFNISDNFKVGYAYDYTLLPGYTKNGSNEIMLEYRLPVKKAQGPYGNAGNSWYR